MQWPLFRRLVPRIIPASDAPELRQFDAWYAAWQPQAGVDYTPSLEHGRERFRLAFESLQIADRKADWLIAGLVALVSYFLRDPGLLANKLAWLGFASLGLAIWMAIEARRPVGVSFPQNLAAQLAQHDPPPTVVGRLAMSYEECAADNFYLIREKSLALSRAMNWGGLGLSVVVLSHWFRIG